MMEPKRGLWHGMLLGSTWNFLAAVLAPVAILFVPFLLIAGTDIKLFALLLGMVVLVCGCLFVIHQAVLAAVTLYYRPQFHAKSAGDLKSHLISWVICADVLLTTGIVMLLRRDDWSLLRYFALFAAAGICGSYLYACSVCASVDLAARSELDEDVERPLPVEPASVASSAHMEAIQTGPSAPNSSPRVLQPTAVEPDLRRKSMPAIRLSVTILCLLPLMMLFGFNQSWHVTFIIALISFGAGHLAESLANG
jgi:hypothetical protein